MDVPPVFAGSRGGPGEKRFSFFARKDLTGMPTTIIFLAGRQAGRQAGRRDKSALFLLSRLFYSAIYSHIANRLRFLYTRHDHEEKT